MQLSRIKSFAVDHTKLVPGMYVSRIDGDAVTYDLRMKKPNDGRYLANASLHTIEHLFATYVRSSALSDNIIYFGPMGCRTGFYFITRGLSDSQAVTLTKEAFEFIASFEGHIPGATAEECGNWLDHDLSGAKAEAREYLAVLKNVDEHTLDYAGALRGGV